MAQHAYEQIAATLRDEVGAGVYPAGAMLPTIPELEQRFRVSRITVRGALEQLSTEGLVYTGYLNGRRGTIVRSRARADLDVTESLRPDRPRIEDDVFSEHARRLGMTAGKRFSMRIERPSQHISERLGVPADDLVVVRDLYQTLDGEPWSRETSFYPRDFAELVEIDVPDDIPEGTTRRMALRGHPETSWIDEVFDRTASPEEAANLNITAGASLLIRLRTGATAERVTRVTENLYLGSRVRLSWSIGDGTGLDLIRDARRRATS